MPAIFLKSQYSRFVSVALIFSSLCFAFHSVDAQTDLHIRQASTGFPVAVPQLCNAGGGEPGNTGIPAVIAKDLDLSGFFNVLSSNTFIETPGKCLKPDQIAFSDWSVIGAEGLVRGEIRANGDNFIVELYLYDVLQKKAVVGKRYEADAKDLSRVAHRFANEIIGFFTGEKGIFGTRIAYVSKVGRFSELFMMDMDGSNSRQLTRDKGLVYSPSWSPTGDRLVYTSYRSKRPELYISSPDNPSPKQLTKDGSLKLGTKFMRDGQSLIGTNSFGGASNIVLYDLRGTILRKLTNSDGIDVSPTLSPDGSSYAFCSNRAGGPQIYVGSVGGGEVRRISFTNSNYCTSPSWSPKGDKIAFVCRSGGNQLFLSSPTGEGTLQLTFAGNNEDPNWSPDGRYLVFSTNFGRGGARNLALLPLALGKPKQLTKSLSDDMQPSWSPKVE